MEDNFVQKKSCPTQMNIVSSSLDEQEPGSVGHDCDTSNSLTKTASSFNDLEKEPLPSPCEGKERSKFLEIRQIIYTMQSIVRFYLHAQIFQLIYT